MNVSPLEGVRLVALDLDGTLLPSDKRISDRAKRVIRDLGDAGIAVTLATGRSWRSAAAYAREMELPHPLVTLEGALVATAGRAAGDQAAAGDRRVLQHRTLHAEQIRDVAEAVADLALGHFLCTPAGRTVACRRLLDRVDQVSIWEANVHFVDDFAAHWVAGDAGLETDSRGYILHMVGPPADVAEAQARMEALRPAGVEYFHGPFWDGFEQLQVRPSGIGKDAGLRHVLSDMGFGPEHVLAAGDWLNDLGMLRMARVAVAPANAVPEVRAVADHVLPETSDEDAVPRFLEAALARMSGRDGAESGGDRDSAELTSRVDGPRPAARRPR